VGDSIPLLRSDPGSSRRNRRGEEEGLRPPLLPSALLISDKHFSRLSVSRSGTVLSSRTLSKNRWILLAQYRRGRGEPGDPPGEDEAFNLLSRRVGVRGGDTGWGISSVSSLSPSFRPLPPPSSLPAPTKPNASRSDPSSLTILRFWNIVGRGGCYTRRGLGWEWGREGQGARAKTWPLQLHEVLSTEAKGGYVSMQPWTTAVHKSRCSWRQDLSGAQSISENTHRGAHCIVWLTRLARTSSARATLSLSVVDGVCSRADTTSRDKNRLNLAKLSTEGGAESEATPSFARGAAVSGRFLPTACPVWRTSGGLWHSPTETVSSDAAVVLEASEEVWCWLGPGSSSSLLVCARPLLELLAGLGDGRVPNLATGLLPPGSAFSSLRSLDPGRKKESLEGRRRRVSCFTSIVWAAIPLNNCKLQN